MIATETALYRVAATCRRSSNKFLARFQADAREACGCGCPRCVDLHWSEAIAAYEREAARVNP